MTFFRLALISFLFVLNLVLAGCASTGPVSLVEVREFADASAKLGGYGELSRRYRDTTSSSMITVPICGTL